MPKKLNFKKKSDYRKWLGYGHATGVFKKTKGHTDIYIKGKKHKVMHMKKIGMGLKNIV